MSAIAFLKFAHLMGLVLGFGCAVLADVLILRQAILRPVTRQLTDWLSTISRFAFLGLLALWASGIGLVAARYAQDAAVLTNQKLWAKVVIVTLLSINGFFVHHHALRLVRSRIGRKLFDHRSRSEFYGLTMIAAVSSVSWIAPIFLGVASELNHQVSVGVVLGVYALFVLVAWCGMMIFISRAVPQIVAARIETYPAIQHATTRDEVHQRYVELLQRVRSM